MSLLPLFSYEGENTAALQEHTHNKEVEEEGAVWLNQFGEKHADN